jgi:hypothetical protein
MRCDLSLLLISRTRVHIAANLDFVN